MRGHSFIAFCFMGLLGTSGSAFAKGPFNPIQIGNWSGGAYTRDDTGAFSHCAVFSPYKSGITLHVSVTESGEWLLAFSHRGWNLDTAHPIPVDLTFDGKGPIRVYAQVKNPQLAVVGMPLIQPF